MFCSVYIFKTLNFHNIVASSGVKGMCEVFVVVPTALALVMSCASIKIENPFKQLEPFPRNGFESFPPLLGDASVDGNGRALHEVVDAEEGHPQAQSEDPADVGQQRQQGHGRLLLEFPHLSSRNHQWIY